MPAASAHNGGRIQVNTPFLQTGGDYPFINPLKTAQAWSPNSGTTPILPSQLDTDGYPTSFGSEGGVFTVFYAPSQLSRPGNYVLRCAGKGTLSLGMNNTVLPTATFTGSVSAGVLTAGAPSGGTIQKGMTLSTGGRVGDQLTGSAGVAGTYSIVDAVSVGSQSITCSGGSLTSTVDAGGRYVFSTTDFRFVVRITARGVSSYVNNVEMCHVDDEALLDAGEIFGVKFKQRLAEAKFGVIRFSVSWLNTNVSNITTWSTRKPTTYWSYSSFELRSSLYAGVTTNSGNAYTTAAFPSIHSSDGTAWTSGAPKDKDTILVLFNTSATQSGTCSLDVGNTGSAINILNAYSNALSVGTNSYPEGGSTKSLACLVYDAVLNGWIKQGGSAEGTTGLNNHVPPELLVRLCGEVGAHPSISIPTLACTPMTNFTTQFATYCRDSGPSWMVPFIEPPNELWNTAAFFYQTTYANNIASAYGWGANQNNEWYGKALSTIGQDVSAVYSDNRTRYRVICGVKTVDAVNGTGTSSSNVRLNSTQYLTGSPAVQSGYVLSAAKNWVTDICCAQYYNPSAQTDGTQATRATAFAGKLFDASASAGVLTVTAINASNSANIAVGDTLFDTPYFAVSGIARGITISSLGTGTGGTGTYNLSQSITFTSRDCSAATDLTAAATYAATANSGAHITRLAGVATAYSAWKTWAQGLGVNRMCGYEGSYSPDFASGGNALADMLKEASKQDPELIWFTFINYNNFFNLTGGGFTADFPSFLSLSFNPNITGYSGNVWPALEDIYQSPNPPQWEALCLIGSGKSRLRASG